MIGFNFFDSVPGSILFYFPRNETFRGFLRILILISSLHFVLLFPLGGRHDVDAKCLELGDGPVLCLLGRRLGRIGQQGDVVAKLDAVHGGAADAGVGDQAREDEVVDLVGLQLVIERGEAVVLVLQSIPVVSVLPIQYRRSREGEHGLYLHRQRRCTSPPCDSGLS